MQNFTHDLRYSIRLLRKSPGFSLAAIAAISLSIAASSAIFSVVNSVLLRPLPFKQPDKLVRIWGKFENQGIPKNWISAPELLDLWQNSESFEDIAAYQDSGVNLTGTGDPVRVNAAQVNATLFRILGVDAIRGRVFADDEDKPGRNRVAILGHALWQKRFAGADSAVGGTVGINGENYTIVGIMPPGFSYPDQDELWTPLAIDPANPGSRGNHGLEVIARCKPDAGLAQANTELSRLATVMREQNPNNYPQTGGFGLYLVRMLDETVGDIRPALYALLGAVTFVLLIACANVANLLLARSTQREKEVSIRAALGARRGRLIQQLLTESVNLAMIGGAIGLGLAYGAVRTFATFGPRDIPRISELGLDWRVVAFSLGLTIVTGIIFGLAPALHVSKPDLHDALKEGARGSTGGRNIVRSLLVLTEIALALVLLVGAGLMIQSVRRLLDLNLGYRTNQTLTMRLSLPTTRYNDNAKITGFYRRLSDSVRTLAGVESSGLVSHLPLTGSYSSGSTAIEDSAAGEGLPTFLGRYPYIEADRRTVSPDYFATLGIRLISGRYFTDADNESAPRVVIVDEMFQHRFWPEGSAIGKRILVGVDGQNPRWGEIVGVVAHVNHYGIDQVKQFALKFDGREMVYFPMEQRPNPRMYLAVRTSSDPTNLTSAIREQVRAIDPDQPIYEVSTMDNLLATSVSRRRLNMILFAAFSAIALVLAIVGIYGVLSYSVTQRTHEIGIRMALGARQRSVLGLVVAQGMTLVAGGLVIGIGAAFALTRLMQSLLFGVSATDPATFGAISVILALVALLACLIPARRASRVDPMVALRYE